MGAPLLLSRRIRSHGQSLGLFDAARLLKAAAARLAKEDGVSLNHWITVAVAQKIGVVETAAGFVKQRAGSTKAFDMLSFLDRAGIGSPLPGDEIEAESRLG